MQRLGWYGYGFERMIADVDWRLLPPQRFPEIAIPMDRKTVELGVLTVLSALICGTAFAFDYVVVCAVFGVLACLIGMITFALIQRNDQAS
jgi:hypothetical protein